MQIPKNTLKSALAEGRPQIGLWVAMANSVSTDIVAGAGFDFILLDGEHAPNDVRSLLAQLQTAAAYPVNAVVRATIGEVSLIKQLLDIGAQSLLVPLVETAEQAALLVRAMRYPPEGIRGVGSSIARSSRWMGIPDYVDLADSEMCLIVQVETKKGLDNLDAIAAVEGVDSVFIGPADLSASLGHRGQPNHPVVQAAMDDAIARIRRAGKAPGILWPDEAGVRRYLALGCTFVAVGADTTILGKGARALAKLYRE